MSGSHRLRIGLVCPYSLDVPGGVQNHVLGLAAYLRGQGHDAYVLAPGELTGDTLGLDPAHFTGTGAALPLRYNGSVARVSFGPLVAARTRHWCREGDFDLLHVHEPLSPSVALLALAAAEVPVVATFHTATPRSRALQLAGAALAGALDKIAAAVAVSEAARDVVVRHLGRDPMIIPNGFTRERYLAPAVTTAGWRNGHRPRLVFVGRLDEPRKGLNVLLDALPALWRIRSDLEVVVAGAGRRVLPPGCRRLGPISERDKAALLASADVFVAPHTERESFGIVLLEAMASAAPVVASDLAPFADLLSYDERGVTRTAGRLFRSGDAADLAAAVDEVLRRPDPARTAQAQELTRRYDWSTVGASVCALYDAVLEASMAAGPEGRLDAAEGTS